MTDQSADYDPTIYSGSAEHYARGRPPYSPALAGTLAAHVALDGRSRLLDVGCGPGIVTLQIAHLFNEAIGLDPDADMLEQAARRAADMGCDNIRRIQAFAEELPSLNLGTFKLVTFGQSFHWTDRERVAEFVYDMLEPGGAIALIVHTQQGRERPDNPGHPIVPLDALNAIIVKFLGPERRAGQGAARKQPDGYADALGRTRFGTPISVFAPGIKDLIVDIDTVVAGLFSMSYAAPHLFREGRSDFEHAVREVLKAHSRDGLFWEWPGDTEILIAKKRG